MFASRTRLVVRQGTAFQRQFGVSAVACNKAVDPIQKLFLDKVNEYKTKSKYVKKTLSLNTPQVTDMYILLELQVEN